MADTFATALRGAPDVTVADEEIQALPYSTMYLRLNDGQRIFVVLGYRENDLNKWLTQDRAMIVTRSGRLVKTVGLHSNLLEVTNLAGDPLVNGAALHSGMQWPRDLRWSEEGELRSARLNSTFTLAGEAVLTIAGQNIDTQIWQENVQSTVPKREWQNTFWIEKTTGLVRQSQQMMGAGVLPAEITLLKPTP
jgi:Protein of unknown function (DUF2886).